MQSKNNTLYDQFAPYFDHYSIARSRYNKAINKLIINYLKDSSKIKVYADFGCGTGKRSQELFKKVRAKKLLLIDSSNMMIKYSQKISRHTINGDFSSNGFYNKVRQVNLATSLWNVFGHIEDENKRFQALVNINKALAPDGIVCIDINNRYNVLNYGWKLVLKNMLKDLAGLRNVSGDIKFSINVQNHRIPAQVHLFSPYEFDQLIQKAQLKVLKKYYINYQTGQIEQKWYRGQILYICGV